MDNHSDAVLRYCPHIGQNVVMEERREKQGMRHYECLNKSECDYDRLGCRNLLLAGVNDKSEAKSAGQ